MVFFLRAFLIFSFLSFNEKNQRLPLGSLGLFDSMTANFGYLEAHIPVLKGTSCTTNSFAS